MRETLPGIDRQTKVYRWQVWQTGTPQEKVYGELMRWAREFKQQYGRDVTPEERNM